MDGADIDQRPGVRRILRVGVTMLASAAGLWFVVACVSKAFANSGSSRVAAALVLTFTIALWPFACVGLLLILGWLVLRIAVR